MSEPELNVSCAICELFLSTRESSEHPGAWWYQCAACGHYQIENRWLAADMVHQLDPTLRLQLAGTIREACDRDRDGVFRELITTENYKAIAARHRMPATPLDQLDRLIEITAARSRFVGDHVSLGGLDALACRLYLPRNDAHTFLSTAFELGFLRNLLIQAENGPDCVLTLGGWQRADQLRRAPHNSTQAFVAMWFHSEMDTIFEQGIKPALVACGYVDYRVDRAAHQNRIDDEIIANIRKSRIMVADFTGMRPNVFYEAGFAMGLGIPVVFTCNESYTGHLLRCAPNGAAPASEAMGWFKQVGESAFDVRQYTFLRWTTTEELAKSLQQRIEALGLSLAVASAV
jgi:nucleoside 2-deoxyribosyltransferase